MSVSQKILTYEEVAQLETGENNESLVDVRTYDSDITSKYEKLDMLPYTGEVILVRDSVAQKLARVNEFLKEKSLLLRVVYGYRHPEIQEKYFTLQRAELERNNANVSSEELDALTHNFVAVPSVAGHPTGGAVDLTMIDSDGNPCDMGTLIADYSDPDKMKTFADDLTETQVANRKILHDAMVDQGFAPFYGEWWHFSYGDLEWACFYEKGTSLYGPILLETTGS